MLVALAARWPWIAGALLALQQQQQPGVKFFSLKDPNPEPSLGWFVLNAFFFVGVALAVVIVIGIAFGSFRYWLLEKFPHNKLNGLPEDDVSTTFRLLDEGR